MENRFLHGNAMPKVFFRLCFKRPRDKYEKIYFSSLHKGGI